MWPVVITVVFVVIKHTIGLRADAADELAGLDVSEHGLLTAYAGFAMMPDTFVDDALPVELPEAVPAEAPVQEAAVDAAKKPAPAAPGGHKLTKVEILCRESRLEALKAAMMQLGITGMTVSHVLGCGAQKGRQEYYRGVPVEATLLPKVQVEIVVSKVPGPGCDRDGQAGALYRSHRRRQDLRLRCGKRSEGSYRRGRVRRTPGCRIRRRIRRPVSPPGDRPARCCVCECVPRPAV